MVALLKKPAVLFCLLVAAALLFRLPATDAGLPYCWHPDEPKLINKGIEILQTGDWNPHWFHYPSLPIYVQALGAALSYLGSMGSTDFVKLADIPTGLDTGLIHTIGDPEMWERGRRITALMGAMTAGLTFLAGRRLFDDTRIGALAGFFVAFSHYHVVHSRFITVDVPTSMALAALLLASAWVYRVGEKRHYLQAAAALGLVIGFKYNAAVAAVLPVTAWLLSERRSERLWLGILLVPLAGVVFVMTMPFALSDVSTALTDMAKEVNHYMYRGHDAASTESGLTHLWKMVRSISTDFLPAWAVGIAGALGLAGRGRWRPVALLAVFPAVYLVYMSGSAVFFKRNIVVLVPALALLAAVGFVWLFEAIAPKLGDRAGLLAKVGVVLLLLPAGVSASETLKSVRYGTDARTEITQWLAEEAPNDWIVAVPVELGIPAEELVGFEHIEVSLLDGGKGWREAGATHVIGSDKLERAGVRKTSITDEAVTAGVNWFAKREPVRARGKGAWALDINARNPTVGVYEVGGNVPASSRGETAAAPVVEGELDDPSRWQVVPAGSNRITFAEGRIRLDAPGSDQPVKVCELARTPVVESIRVVGRWRYEGLTRERMAGQLTARFFTGDGSLIEGETDVDKGIQLIAQGVASADWSDLDVVIEAPPRAKKVRLCAELGSEEGFVEIDDLRLSD
ncbi:MAG TPA: glycosyltransferase family 39 protein [Myxococcota bacterium]|nr:glycosyltransferase family 39 protein [Myxococcota bacterium]